MREDIEAHMRRHQALHDNLDELVADFITQTGRLPNETTVMDLISWSHEQTIHPTCRDGGSHA